ncbi:hypothetical protein [Pedobacter chitinilyticus]|uniref:DUF302 domain-containing protein n=1 Tax=Pedobacter chitinilyticus TaxID=2233776 RepID=A0A3S4RNS3_9SPHI|nr:hypothetical protein [Pedobacter chitinilyticus]RWU05016.1 hypothetical protein DPV69_17795 [Pedobacter chitinilyticus]
MSQVFAFRSLMLALRHSVLSAAAGLNRTTEKVFGAYLEADGQTPKRISVTGAAAEMRVPLLAMAPLTALGINSVSFKMTLPVFTKDGELWISLDKGAPPLKEIQVSVCIDPHEDLTVFLERVKGLEQGFLAEVL